MPYRLTTALPGYHRYATLCPQCGRQRGWALHREADRHLAELQDSGLVMDGTAHSETYEPGDDGTCPGHVSE